MLAVKAFNTIDQAAERALDTARVAEQVGASVETIAALREEATRTGTSFVELEKRFGTFTRRLGQASSETTTAGGTFKKMNTEAKELRAIGLDPEKLFKAGGDEALMQTLDHLAKLPTAAERGAAAFMVFGRQAVDMAPLLNRGAAGIDAMKRKMAES